MDDTQDLDAVTEAEVRRLLATAFETVPAGTGLAGNGLAGNGLAGNGLAGAELLRRVRRRTARQRRARTLVPAGAIAALGGAAALGVTLTATVADAPSALAAVTAAAAKTSAESFIVTQVFSAPSEDGKQMSWRSSGVFDPRHGLGKEIVGGIAIRFIGGTMYSQVGASSPLSHGKPWTESLTPPVQSTGPAAASGWITQGFSLNQPIDPSALLGLLKSAASVEAEGAASGPGWTGTKYAITAEPPKGATIGGTTTGTVYVDDQGRVRRLVTTLTWQLPGSSTRQHDTTDVTLGGFGVRVSVAPPPASQVYNLGKAYIVVSPSGIVEPLPKFSP